MKAVKYPVKQIKIMLNILLNILIGFKTYVMNLINVDNSEGISYRDSIANLHESLLGAAITTTKSILVFVKQFHLPK